MEERQVYGEVGVFMDNLHKNLSHGQGDIQLFPALPDQGLRPGLAGLHLAAHKFPQ